MAYNQIEVKWGNQGPATKPAEVYVSLALRFKCQGVILCHYAYCKPVVFFQIYPIQEHLP